MQLVSFGFVTAMFLFSFPCMGYDFIPWRKEREGLPPLCSIRSPFCQGTPLNQASLSAATSVFSQSQNNS
jgi:hypothetical protein